MKDTIFALATVVGKSGVAIIRISGGSAKEALRSFGVDMPVPRTATYVSLKDDDGLIDRGIVIFFPGPKSFTGEDVVEFQVHGSRAVIKSCIDRLSLVKGFRIAEPGEFSKRAFLNGRMDLTQAEGLADLIEAETESQRKQAIRQMDGQLARLYEGWRTELLDLQALTEAFIDFPEEEIPSDLLEQMNEKRLSLVTAIHQHLDDNSRGERIRNGFQIAIVGPPNVGKSSLINFLAKQDVAIVSNIPGTTRDILQVNLDIGGYPVNLIDTAGIREATNDIIEQEGIRRAKQAAETADIKIYVTEINLENDPQGLDEKTILVYNKSDLSTQRGLQNHERSTLYISAKTGHGVDELLWLIKDRIASQYGVEDQPLITRARYRGFLQQVFDTLKELDWQKPVELVAEDLRAAAAAIGKITGKIEVDDILDRIFGQFCIGK